MKIGFDAKRAFSNKSGLGNYSRDIIRSLHEQFPDNQYILFTPNPTTDLLKNDYTKHIISPKIKIKIVKSFWRSVKMGKDIENQNLDVFHGLSNELPTNIKKTKALKIVTIHDLIFLKFPALYSLTDRNIYTWKFKNACLNADKIIATSNQTKLDIIKYFNISENKINVVYQSCNKIFESIANEEQKIEVRKKYNLPSDFILTVGTIERRKNALNVLKALYYFNLDIHYVIIGRSTKYTEEIISFAKEHKIENQITILNGVHTEDLPAIYQMSRIFVYPSIYEGFGIPIIEAFNSKVPIITSNTGSTAEISGDAAVQVDPLNSKNIGIAIKSILESNDLSEQLIQQGLNRAKLFDQKIVCNNIMNIYKGL